MASGLTVWLTGLPGSGKTTSSLFLLHELQRRGVAAISIDGDLLRRGLSSDLGFSEEDRTENVRRAGEIALLLASQGVVVVVSLVSPRRRPRAAVRDRHVASGIPFLEVHVAAPIAVCEERDPKSLYRKARSGKLDHMTGVDDVYEPPLAAEVVLETGTRSVEETGAQLVAVVLDTLGKPSD